MIGVIGFGTSLGLLQELGVTPKTSPIADQILRYTEFAREQLNEMGAQIHGSDAKEQQSGITSFTLPNIDLAHFRSRCLNAGVVLSHRDGRLRISPHAYNNQDDLDRLLNLIRVTPEDAS